jgi:hypothetical protein
MTRSLRIIAQGFAYAAFAALVGYFAAAPAYTYWDPHRAQIKLSFSHPGKPIRECRRLTPQEIAKLAPNMRKPMDCPRERLPVLVELALDGKLLYRAALPPTGLWNDGQSVVYQKFAVAPGRHRLVARLRDSRRTEGFDYERIADIDLRPRQHFVIDFRTAAGGFVFG